MNIELKELRIIFQNALAHATRISIHNNQILNKPVNASDVITIAKEIAREVVSLGSKKEGE